MVSEVKGVGSRFSLDTDGLADKSFVLSRN